MAAKWLWQALLAVEDMRMRLGGENDCSRGNGTRGITLLAFNPRHIKETNFRSIFTCFYARARANDATMSLYNEGPASYMQTFFSFRVFVF